MSKLFSWGPTALKALNGVFCVYKPADISLYKLTTKIKVNLTEDLNKLACYEYEIKASKGFASNNIEKGISTDTHLLGKQDYSEHRLVLGNRYILSDIKLELIDPLDKNASGILVMSVGPQGQQDIEKVEESMFLRVYHIKGRLGWASDDYSTEGKIIERSQFGHVSRFKLDKVCTSQMHEYRKQMQLMSGFSPQSQKAYEMAAQGIFRPAHGDTNTVVYSIRCIDFQKPNFTLEVHTTNEHTHELMYIIHRIGLQLKTNAVCSGIRRLRYGYFTTNRALVSQQWRLDDIVENIALNRDLLQDEKLFVPGAMQQVKLEAPKASLKGPTLEQLKTPPPQLSENNSEHYTALHNFDDKYMSDKHTNEANVIIEKKR